MKLDQLRRAAQIDSAVAVNSQTRQAIQASLERMYGPGLEAAFAEDPRLIAGMRVKVGSDVYDGSLRAALDALAAKI